MSRKNMAINIAPINLLCALYYVAKIIRHQYLGHKNFIQIGKFFNSIQGALFIGIISAYFFRVYYSMKCLINGEPIVNAEIFIGWNYKIV